MTIEYNDELCHYGVKRRSGRYPWGSGEDPYQHSRDFIGKVEKLKKEGLSEKEIMDYLKINTSQYRTLNALAKEERKLLNIQTAHRLKEKEGLNNSEIARKMGTNESTIRSWLSKSPEIMNDSPRAIADQLMAAVKNKGMIDVGAGVELELGVSKEKLNQALFLLENEGYKTYGRTVEQVTNAGRQTILKVLTPPGTEQKDIYDFNKINSFKDYKAQIEEKKAKAKDPNYKPEKPDHFVYPESLDSKRLSIRYAEEGGVERDGTIELRRGKADLDLGGAHYAQVRIMVDGTHYLKGMAHYSDDLPDGVDVRFNTNKKKGTPMGDVLKEIKKDPENPFGSLIKEGGQSYWYDKDGKQHLSLINKRAEEGDWGEWADNLPSQFLSKQHTPLVKNQLNIAKDNKRTEFESIMALENPTVKKKFLNSFAEDCDAAAVHLKAAALPRQRYQVILPIPDLKDTEIYAPNYNSGERVCLVRYPHGGVFEIPTLTVNNNHKTGKKVLGNALDAVGINSKVAERLSGADFDGDTVMVIPINSKVKIKTAPELSGLKGFDPKKEYPARPGMKKMKATGLEMGKISNLITDMTLQGATDDELARAVRHSMVVIDAEKHKLDYKKSEIDNNIQGLKDKYQKSIGEDGKAHYGAATIVSRAKGQYSVPKRRGQAWINKDTGEEEWERINPKTGQKETKYTGESYVDKKTGKTVVRTQKSTLMAETKDARKLVFNKNNDVEMLYADYANTMKALANESRKAMVNTGNLTHNKEAAKTYAKEVGELKSALNVALKNKPKERKAQILANAEIKDKIQANPDMTKAEIKKAKTKALEKARQAVGAKREQINITERQWEAIQKGAISENTLSKILDNADMDKVREYATPKAKRNVTSGQKARIKILSEAGYTSSQIADATGLTVSMVQKEIKSLKEM